MQNEQDYLANARLNESQIIRKYASCMIDTSDGFLNSLDILVRVNEKGIQIPKTLDTLLHPLATNTVSKYGLSPWTLLAGEFGDYELIFSIPESKTELFETEYNSQFKNLIQIGIATEDPNLKICNTSGIQICYDASNARNLYRQSSKDQKTYIEKFLELGKSLGF